MRTAIIVVCGILAVRCISVGQEPQLSAHQISVLGSVELKEPADQASFTFSMKGVGSSLRRAVQDANTKVLSLTNKLLLIGLSAKDISTSQFYSGENYGDKAFLSSSRDFRAVLTTLVKVDSLKLLDTLLYTVSDAEVETLSDIAFSFKDELGLRKKARAAAAAKAKEKADDFANALGISVGSIISVEELESAVATRSANQIGVRGGRGFEMSYNYPNPFNPVTVPDMALRPALDESRGSGFFARTISITSQVRVVFGIERKPPE